MNLEAIVRHYITNYRPHKQTELDWFRRQLSLESAIKIAAKAEDHRGKRYSHQSRITTKAMRKPRLLLEKHEYAEVQSFHELGNASNILGAITGSASYIFMTRRSGSGRS